MTFYNAIFSLSFLWGILTILHTAVLAVTVLPEKGPRAFVRAWFWEVLLLRPPK
jgi:hypothetical protein